MGGFFVSASFETYCRTTEKPFGIFSLRPSQTLQKIFSRTGKNG
jgi:hypothetical protein